MDRFVSFSCVSYLVFTCLSHNQTTQMYTFWKIKAPLLLNWSPIPFLFGTTQYTHFQPQEISQIQCIPIQYFRAFDSLRGLAKVKIFVWIIGLYVIEVIQVVFQTSTSHDDHFAWCLYFEFLKFRKY